MSRETQEELEAAELAMHEAAITVEQVQNTYSMYMVMVSVFFFLLKQCVHLANACYKLISLCLLVACDVP